MRQLKLGAKGLLLALFVSGVFLAEAFGVPVEASDPACLKALESQAYVSVGADPDAFINRVLMSERLGLPRIQAAFKAALEKPFPNIFASLLRELGGEVRLKDGDLAPIPKVGSGIVVANHPFGLVDGMAMGDVLSRVRSDFKIVVNGVLKIPSLKDHLIPVNLFPPVDKEANKRALVEAAEWVKAGHLLAIFPSGFVARVESRGDIRAQEQVWRNGLATLLSEVQPPIVPLYFYGQNSRAFQRAGFFHTLIQVAMLGREALLKAKQGVDIHIGGAIQPAEYQGLIGSPDLLPYLRARTLELSDYRELNLEDLE